MRWDVANKRVVLLIAHYQHLDNSLNHQLCTAMTLDPTALAITRNYGQLSSHSLGNSVILGPDGDFVGMDLGDNYPRGVFASHTWRAFPLASPATVPSPVG